MRKSCREMIKNNRRKGKCDVFDEKSWDWMALWPETQFENILPEKKAKHAV